MTLRLVEEPTIRAQLERLAHWSLTGRVDEAEVARLLAKLSPLPEADALLWFADLCEGVAALSLPWWEVIPDAVGIAREEQAEDAALDRIKAALNALTLERTRT